MKRKSASDDDDDDIPLGDEAKHHKTPYSQEGGTCYAHAVADALIALQMRCFKWTADQHQDMVRKTVAEFGKDGANVEDVLDWLVTKYATGLKFRKVDLDECISSLKKGRVVIASIVMDQNGWENFSQYFENYKEGVISPEFIGKPKRGMDHERSGHAVLLVDYEPKYKYFKAKNSWGKDFADNGYFKIKDSVFKRFFDLYCDRAEDV
jgi:hypothetical protein